MVAFVIRMGCRVLFLVVLCGVASCAFLAQLGASAGVPSLVELRPIPLACRVPLHPCTPVSS